MRYLYKAQRHLYQAQCGISYMGDIFSEGRIYENIRKQTYDNQNDNQKATYQKPLAESLRKSLIKSHLLRVLRSHLLRVLRSHLLRVLRSHLLRVLSYPPLHPMGYPTTRFVPYLLKDMGSTPPRSRPILLRGRYHRAQRCLSTQFLHRRKTSLLHITESTAYFVLRAFLVVSSRFFLCFEDPQDSQSRFRPETYHIS